MEQHISPQHLATRHLLPLQQKRASTYLLWPSNFRIINPRNVFCGATWPLLTGMFTEYPTTSSRSAFTSKIPKLQMLALGAVAFTADHSRSVRARSLSALSQWPSLLSSQPVCLSMWISPRRSARSRGGLSELRWVRPAFRVADGRDPDVLRGAVLRAGSGHWLICQREWRGSQGA